MRIDSAPATGHAGVSLRQLERTDLDAWYAYLSNPEVVRHTSWNPRSSEDLLPMFDGFESPAPQSIRRLAMIDDAPGDFELYARLATD